jgi:predicted nucleic acid-binding protein
MKLNGSLPMVDFFCGPVVCNTGPVLGLSRAGLCRLLDEIFPVVIIPAPVFTELHFRVASDAAEVARVVAVAQVHELLAPPDPLLLGELDAGESAVIQTAREIGISSVLIDERKARRLAATVYGLEVKGTCALLLEAKRRELISHVAPALAAMVSGGYFIGPRVKAECLKLAGE